MLTGESDPILKEKEAEVVGGSLLKSGSLRMQATAVGKATVLSQIIQLVKRAQADKPEIQKLADQISAIFVPAVVGIALLTFLLSYLVFDLSLQASIIHAVAVLVISCPCAMGLATPTAVVVGIGRATRKGILIKGGRTLEAFSKVKYVVFDKTGTLTTGNFAIEAIHCPEGEREAVENVIFSLEKHSSHPIAQSLLNELSHAQTLSLKEVEEVEGYGISATDEAGHRYRLGSYRWAQNLTEEDQHNLYLLKDDQLWASIDLKDEVRPEASEAIQSLKSYGLTPVLLSGDRAEKCQQVADALGIEEVYAEQLPAEKLAIIDKLNEQGGTAMVGDGINDAPALAKATVGISLSQATQAAIQSAQIVLLQGNLSALGDLLAIGKHTVLTIKQNLFWAFAYNVVAIPLAAFGYLSPILGAAAMAFSDVVVVGNSLRLRVKRMR
jgi:Cu+-exporting ATPase